MGCSRARSARSPQVGSSLSPLGSAPRAPSLANRVEVVAHKLVRGQRIRQHNDFIPGYETHRLTLQLNRGLDEAAGGWFVLFSGPEPSDIHKILLPRHNSALGFAISQSSFHAVSPLARSERYTLVFSFYERRSHEQAA